MERIALFPGSFDPFTKGHQDIVTRGLKLFDKVIIGIGHNTQKARYFDLEKILNGVKQTFEGYENVETIIYNDLTAVVAKKHGAYYLLRGLRNTTDFEYENSISQVNKHLNPDLETVFLITSPYYASISSSVIREVHRYGESVDDFLPYKI